MELIILRIVAIVFVVLIVFIIGFLVAICSVPDEAIPCDCIYDEQCDMSCVNLKVYCFQCEIEMRVKEKGGELYCANCGLRHQ